MKTKIFSLILILFLLGLFKSQVLIAKKSTVNGAPDHSAVLELRDDSRGVLFPRVPLLTISDNITVPNPVAGLLVYNSNTEKLNFWEAGKWNKNFGIEEGLAIIKVTENKSGSSTSSLTNSTFPTQMPLFNLNDPVSTEWKSLGASTNITITKTSNSNYIITEGMVQINNDTDTNQEFQFAIGVFVNGQLKLASKYNAVGKNYVCNWRKFNLSGVFNDLPIGTYTVSIYGRNLPKITSGYTSVTYGGNSSNCSNINNDMSKIFVTAQVTQ
jgi:hypothetical protein